MTSMTYNDDAAMARYQSGIEAERAKIVPSGRSCFIASASALGIAIACASEAFSLTVALHAYYPALSTGVDLGSDMALLRWSIIPALGLGHFVLYDGGDRASGPVRRVIRKLRLVPLAAVIGGMSVFMAIATAQTGGEDGSGGFAALGLGLACSGLFGASFIASTKLMGFLLPALDTILTSRAQRATVERIANELAAADACRARIETLRREIASREAPGVLRWKAAEEAAAMVGAVAADAHDRHASREALGDDIRPEDVIDLPMPDTPLPALDKLQRYLKTFTAKHFFDLLKTKEA